MAFYHTQTRSLVVDPSKLPAELLRDLRAALPDDDKYHLRYVMFPVNAGLSGDLDSQWLVESLQKLGVWAMTGVPLVSFHEALQKVASKMPEEVKARRIDLRPLNLQTADVSEPDRTPAHAPVRTFKVVPPGLPTKSKATRLPRQTKPSKAVHNKPAPRTDLREGMKVQVMDKRRTQVGVIQNLGQEEATVLWNSGMSRQIALSRLTNPRKYALG